MPWRIRLQHKTPKREGEMKVWVRCARGVQVAYFTLHHSGCTLVSPSSWAKQVPRVPKPHPTSCLSTRRHRQPSADPRAPGETESPPLPLGATPSVRPSPPSATTHPAPQGATTIPHQSRPVARPQAHPHPGGTHPLPMQPHHPRGLGTLQDMPPARGKGHTSGLVSSGSPTAT